MTEATLRPFATDGLGRVSAEALRETMGRSILMGGGVFVSPLWRSQLQGSVVNPSILAMAFPRSNWPFFLANDMRLLVDEPRGFVAHLSALTLQFEMEALAAHVRPTTVVNHVIHRAWTSPADSERLTTTRQLILGHSLAAESPENLLFAAIHIQALLLHTQRVSLVNGAGFLSQEPLQRLRLTLASGLLIRLRRLEAQGLFPENLPSNERGGRDQDYLWQREAGDWRMGDGGGSPSETRVWSGVDYTLLVGIISSIVNQGW